MKIDSQAEKTAGVRVILGGRCKVSPPLTGTILGESERYGYSDVQIDGEYTYCEIRTIDLFVIAE